MRRLAIVVFAAAFAVGVACSHSLPPTTRVEPSLSSAVAGPTLPDARRLYDAGKYNDLVTAVRQVAANGGVPMPALVYLAGRSLEKLNDPNSAREMYQRLAESGGPAWADIGRSALALLDGRSDDALMAAQNAARDGTLPESYFQLGLVLMARMDIEGAANAFETATMMEPTFAAAHYYAGVADSRLMRFDQMQRHFDTFLRLAPDAPEEGEVETTKRAARLQ